MLWRKTPPQSLGGKLNRGQRILNFMRNPTGDFSPSFHAFDLDDLGHIFKEAQHAKGIVFIVRQRCPCDQEREDLAAAVQAELALLFLAVSFSLQLLNRQKLTHDTLHFLKIIYWKNLAVITGDDV